MAAVKVLDPLIVLVAKIGRKFALKYFVLLVQVQISLQALFEVNRCQ